MSLENRLQVLQQLGNHILEGDEYLDAIRRRTYHENNWFTLENTKLALQSIAKSFLQKEQLVRWVRSYDILNQAPMKTIALILAGNIPLVGFHDVLSVFVCGHKAKIKLSEKDKYLLPYLIKLLNQYSPGVKQDFEFVEIIKGFDAVVATGSNNSARYFEAYFGKYPHIIRKNRNAVAVLLGDETEEELLALGQDIFQYFGLGCRSVAKLYLPEGYDFNSLLEALHQYKKMVTHNKYKNNFDYNYALFIMNKISYQANGCIMLKEDPSLQSRIATLHYEYYKDETTLCSKIKHLKSEIQCVVAKKAIIEELQTVPFGMAQQPQLWDYADGVDTIQFLLTI